MLSAGAWSWCLVSLIQTLLSVGLLWEMGKCPECLDEAILHHYIKYKALTPQEVSIVFCIW